jgi:hypothetical protein
VTDQFVTVEMAITGAAPMDAELQQAANTKLGDEDKPDLRVERDYGSVYEPIMKGLMADMYSRCGHCHASRRTRRHRRRLARVTEHVPHFTTAGSARVTSQWSGKAKPTSSYRKKELLKYRGLQIAPAELENHLITHPGILEGTLAGISIESDSEVPRVYVGC